MCLAILKLAGETVIKRHLHNGYKNNPDGAGFMYARNGQLIISKGYFSFKGFYKDYRNAEHKNPDSNFVIHFRIATSGKTDVKTCHPFYIDEKIGFAHNGIFNNYGDKTISDTQEFNQKILKYCPKNFIYSEAWLDLLETYCELNFNKLVFLNNENDWFIVNENAGVWKNDVWFSNSTYEHYVEIEKWDNCDICSSYYPENDLIEEEYYKICENCSWTLFHAK